VIKARRASWAGLVEVTAEITSRTFIKYFLKIILRRKETYWNTYK
jgi:hypothetical protein